MRILPETELIEKGGFTLLPGWLRMSTFTGVGCGYENPALKYSVDHLGNVIYDDSKKEKLK